MTMGVILSRHLYSQSQAHEREKCPIFQQQRRAFVVGTCRRYCVKRCSDRSDALNFLVGRPSVEIMGAKTSGRSATSKAARKHLHGLANSDIRRTRWYRSQVMKRRDVFSEELGCTTIADGERQKFRDDNSTELLESGGEMILLAGFVLDQKYRYGIYFRYLVICTVNKVDETSFKASKPYFSANLDQAAQHEHQLLGEERKTNRLLRPPSGRQSRQRQSAGSALGLVLLPLLGCLVRIVGIWSLRKREQGYSSLGDARLMCPVVGGKAIDSVDKLVFSMSERAW